MDLASSYLERHSAHRYMCVPASPLLLGLDVYSCLGKCLCLRDMDVSSVNQCTPMPPLHNGHVNGASLDKPESCRKSTLAVRLIPDGSESVREPALP